MAKSEGDLEMRLWKIGDSTIRIRASLSGNFEQTIPERFGFVLAESGEYATTDRATLSEVPLAGGFRARLDSGAGRLVLDTLKAGIEFELRATDSRAGFTLSVSMSATEAFYGLGFQRTSLDLRGHALEWHRAYRSRGATVPFFMSSAGYGFYSNNTWRHTFDFTGDTTYTVTATSGEIDFFVFTGPSYASIIDSYTALTGRPRLLPRWIFGLLYICRYYEDQNGVLEIAEKFRQRGIPCDSIGLEPGWEDVPYSMDWKWSPDRFPDPRGMIEKLHDLGYRFELWESGAAPKREYADPAVRRNWYERRVAATLDIGVDFFKQDDPYPRMLDTDDEHELESDLEIDGIGTVPGAAVSNLANSLYSETAIDEFTRRTGRRGVIMFHSYMASVASHRWGYGWAGDFAAGCGLLCASLSGHSTVSIDMHTNDPAGIHVAFFTPVPLIDSWASYKEPWLYSRPHETLIRNYAELRQRLWPYLYNTHRTSMMTGMPMMRPMVLEVPDDPNVRNLTTQHMIGDGLLVGFDGDGDGKSGTGNLEELIGGGPTRTNTSHGPGGARVYLPAGEWIDYWTGKRIASDGTWVSSELPGDVGGPLFVKAGAIIPMAPLSHRVGDEPLELVILDVYPPEESSRDVPFRGSFDLYEDDGTTPAYLDGEYALTTIRCAGSGGAPGQQVSVTIGGRTGSYAGMSGNRGFLIRLFTQTTADRVILGGAESIEPMSLERLLVQSVSGWAIDEIEGCIVVKPEAGWRVDRSVDHSGRIHASDVVWDNAHQSASEVAVTVHLGEGFIPRKRAGFDIASTVTPDSGGELSVEIAVNPPERVALNGGGAWLRYTATIYGAIYRNGVLNADSEDPVTLEISDDSGSIIRELTATNRHGSVVFPSVEYTPEKTHFRLRVGTTTSKTVTVRDFPDIPGVSRDQLAAPLGE